MQSSPAKKKPELSLTTVIQNHNFAHFVLSKNIHNCYETWFLYMSLLSGPAEVRCPQHAWEPPGSKNLLWSPSNAVMVRWEFTWHFYKDQIKYGNSVPLAVLSSSAFLCYVCKVLIFFFLFFFKVNGNISTPFRMYHIRHCDNKKGKEGQIRINNNNDSKSSLNPSWPWFYIHTKMN